MKATIHLLLLFLGAARAASRQSSAVSMGRTLTATPSLKSRKRDTAPWKNARPIDNPKTISRSLSVVSTVPRGGSSSTTTPATSTLASLVAWTMLGSSVGFYIFLYFTSMGYALGIGLPVMAAWIGSSSSSRNAHAFLVALWSLRSFSFWVWREYINWPTLHVKIVQVHADQSPSLAIKFLCWFMYSFFYACLASCSWIPLIYNYSASPFPLRRLTLLLQVLGLGLETVADWQKSHFKASVDRHGWCQTGLWRYSTHPNYAGEWLFWLGTLSAGLSKTWQSSTRMSTKALQSIFMMTGFAFWTTILRGATHNLDHRHSQKYGLEHDQFRNEYGVFGPRVRTLQRLWLRTKMHPEDTPVVVDSEAASEAMALGGPLDDWEEPR